MKNIENVKQFCKDRKCSIYEVKQIRNDKEQLQVFGFINRQKKNLKKGLYDYGKYAYKKEILQSIGITKEDTDTLWDFMFTEWIKAKEKYGNKIPCGYKVLNGNNLYSWIIFQRKCASTGTLSDDRLKRLKENGFIFEKKHDRSIQINVYHNGVFLNKFNSIKEATEMCNIKFDKKIITEILNGKRNNYLGYYFEKVV